MPSKKRTYLQQFSIIHLPNPDLTFIRNPEKETKLYLCPSTSWKLKSGTFLCYLFLFLPSHLTRNHDANRAPRAYICALEAGFSSCQKLPSLLPNCWMSIFNIFVKNQRWQLDLPNYGRCSYSVLLPSFLIHRGSFFFLFSRLTNHKLLEPDYDLRQRGVRHEHGELNASKQA